VRVLKFAIGLILLMSIFLALPTCVSQEPVKLDKAEWSLLIADAGVRGLDVYTTHLALSRGNKEHTLPGWVVNHPAVMSLYSGGVVATQYFVAKSLVKHHHSKWAKVMTTVDLSVTTPFVINNALLPDCRAPKIYTIYGCQDPTVVPSHF
jgi:hypothetical protein